MLRGRFAFRLPWGKYLSIQIAERWELPHDWRSIAYQMLAGERPADADLLARAWFKTQCEAQAEQNRLLERIRLLERKIHAQRAELRRAPLKGSAGQ